MSSSSPLGVSDAAEKLQVTRRAVLYAIERGDLKAQKLPGRQGAYVLELEDIEAFGASRTRKPVASS